jgi:hypothetical protein
MKTKSGAPEISGSPAGLLKFHLPVGDGYCLRPFGQLQKPPLRENLEENPDFRLESPVSGLAINQTERI